MVLLSLSFDSLHGILRRLYDEMTEQLLSVIPDFVSKATFP